MSRISEMYVCPKKPPHQQQGFVQPLTEILSTLVKTKSLDSKVKSQVYGCIKC